MSQFRFENKFLTMTKLTEGLTNDIDSNNNSKKAKIEANNNLNNSNNEATINAQLNHINLLIDESNENNVQIKQAPLWSPNKTKIQQVTQLIEFRSLIETKYKIKLGKAKK